MSRESPRVISRPIKSKERPVAMLRASRGLPRHRTLIGRGGNGDAAGAVTLLLMPWGCCSFNTGSATPSGSQSGWARGVSIGGLPCHSPWVPSRGGRLRVLWFGLAGTCAEKRSITVIGQCGHAENDGAIGFAIGARFASRKNQQCASPEQQSTSRFRRFRTF